MLFVLLLTATSYAANSDKAETHNKISCSAPSHQHSTDSSNREMSLHADNITRNKEGDVILEGNVHLFRKEQYMQGRKITINKKKNTIEILNGSYTRCPADSKLWSFKASRILINQEKNSGLLYNGALFLGKMPVAYLPVWWFVPDKNKRSSRFLEPDIRSGDEGLEIKEGYFINLAPHYDLTLGVDFIEDRGIALYADFNFNRPNNDWRIYLKDLERDKLDESNVRHNRDPRVDALGRRNLYHLKHSSVFENGFSANIDFTHISDAYFGDDFGLGNIKHDSTLYLMQDILLRWQNPHWDLQLGNSSHQAINGGAPLYRIAPYAIVRYLKPAESFRPEYQLNIDYAQFNHPLPNRAEAERLRIDSSIAYPMRWRGGEIRPWLGWRQLRITAADGESHTTTAPSAGLSMHLIFERSTQRNNIHYQHSLQPKLFYLYHRRKQDTQINNFDSSPLAYSIDQGFRETRFSGGDFLEDTEHVGIGIEGAIVNSQNGQTIIRGGINQIFYLQDRIITENAVAQTAKRSAIATNLAFNAGNHTLIEQEWIWDTQNGNIDGVWLNLNYQPSDVKHHVAFSYRYERQLTGSQVEISQLRSQWRWQMTSRWRWENTWDYDVRRGWNINTRNTIKYQGCCFSIDFGYTTEQDDGPDSEGNIIFSISL